jgi:hypothetical protein
VSEGVAAAEAAVRLYESHPQDDGFVLMPVRHLAAVADCIDHFSNVPECEPALWRIEESTFLNAREALAAGISIDEHYARTERRSRKRKKQRR